MASPTINKQRPDPVGLTRIYRPAPPPLSYPGHRWPGPWPGPPACWIGYWLPFFLRASSSATGCFRRRASSNTSSNTSGSIAAASSVAATIASLLRAKSASAATERAGAFASPTAHTKTDAQRSARGEPIACINSGVVKSHLLVCNVQRIGTTSSACSSRNCRAFRLSLSDCRNRSRTSATLGQSLGIFRNRVVLSTVSGVRKSALDEYRRAQADGLESIAYDTHL